MQPLPLTNRPPPRRWTPGPGPRSLLAVLIVAVDPVLADGTLRIRRIAPTFGSPGDTFFVHGDGFSTKPANHQVHLGGTSTEVLESTPDHLQLRVPPGATSGTITVGLDGNSAESADVFRVLPAAVPSASVGQAYVLAADGAVRDIATVASKKLVLFYDAAAGAAVSLDILRWTRSGSAAVPYSVYAPNGVRIASGSLTELTPTLHLPIAQAPGQYVLVLEPQGWLRASVQLSADTLLTADAAPAEFSIDRRYATRRVIVAAQAGDLYGIGFTDFAALPAPPGYSLEMRLLNPDGQQRSYAICSSDNVGCGLDLRQISAAGRYQIVLNGNPASTRNSGKIWLSRDLVQSISVNTVTPLALPRPGQNARLTFNGAAGQRLRLAGQTLTSAPQHAGFTMSVLKPDGSCLHSACWAALSLGGRSRCSRRCRQAAAIRR